MSILFPNAFAPALVAALARVPVRVGYAAQGRGLLLTHPLPVPGWRAGRHEVFYYLNVAAELERLLTGSSSTGAAEPHAALTAGADLLVVGRAVTAAADPEAAAQALASSLAR